MLSAMARTKTTPEPMLGVAELVAELDAAPARGRARKSRLYLWLRQNHDDLVIQFDRNPPSWDRLAAILGSRGILDGDGKPPTSRGARGAWYRVRAEVKAASEKKQAHSTPGVKLTPQVDPLSPSTRTTDHAKPTPLPQGKAESETAESKALVDAEEPAPAEFGFARIRHAQTTPISRKPLSAPPLRRDPDEVIARKTSQRKPGAFPMPTPIEPEDE